MRNRAFLVIFCLFCLHIYGIKRHVIGCEPLAGLFYNFLGVISNLTYCQKNCIKPIVFWGPQNLYYQEEGYKGKHNVWEYYFEPVSEESYNGTDPLWKINATPDGMEIIPVRQNLCTNYENNDIRFKAYSIITKYIKVRYHIQKKVNTFFAKRMAGKKTIGIHLRGTDKKFEVGTIDVEALLDTANTVAKKIDGDVQFFVATDDEVMLKKAKSILHHPIITYDSTRSVNGLALHHDRKNKNKAVLGEEVIIEVLLLAQCDHFLHGCSAVSTAVLFFNPWLPHTSFKAIH